MPEQLTGDPTKKNVLAGLLLDGEAAPAGCCSLDWPPHPGRPCGRLVINARPVNVATVRRGSQGFDAASQLQGMGDIIRGPLPS